MGRFHFLKEKKFYLHLLLTFLASFVLLWLTFIILKAYTRHNKEFDMPSFVGQDFQQVKKENSEDFNFIVIDSVYPKGHQDDQPGTIIQQNPEPGSKVKKGRNVYAIIVATTPEPTIMPALKGISLREAIGRLESNGLEVEHLEYKAYPYKNNVIEQYFQGKPIQDSVKIIKGSKIVLHVGIGEDKTNIKVPNLIGKPAEETKRLLNLAGFNLGKEVFEDSDSIQYMCIKKMTPGPSSSPVKPGTYIDVWYHSSRTMDFKKEKNNLLREDSIANAPKPIKKVEIDTIKETIETTDYEEKEEFDDEF